MKIEKRMLENMKDWMTGNEEIPEGWLYDSIERTREVARWTAEVTHNHPEGIKGAEATASAIFLARNGNSKDEIKQYIISFASVNLPAQKPVFFIATCGSPRKNYFDEIKGMAKSRDCTDLGSYLCCGYDTYGPFKIIGGLKKGHPTEKEIQDAVDFYIGLGA